MLSLENKIYFPSNDAQGNAKTLTSHVRSGNNVMAWQQISENFSLDC